MSRTCAASFRRAFRFILVDEFQDTDPLQAELLLDARGRRAGVRPADPSRRAVRRRRSEAVDLSLPPRRHRHLSRASASGSIEAAPARSCCSTSFRSVPAHSARGERCVQHAMLVRDDESLQADYVELLPDRADQQDSRRSWRCRYRGLTAGCGSRWRASAAIAARSDRRVRPLAG